MTLPDLPAAFRWSREVWGPAVRCVPLEAVAPHFFSSRHLPVTTPEGGRQAAAAVGAARLAMVSQVHGADVVQVDDEPLPPATTGDALVAKRSEVAIGIRAADCVPILLADAATGAVAAVHAGWRGTAAGVARAAVAALERRFGARPRDLVAAVGPAIGSCCYEVGSELVDAFAAAGHGRELIDRWFVARSSARAAQRHETLHLDLPGANRDQLVLAGLPEDRIHVCGLCTAMHLDVLTSWRAERERAGRMAAVIRSRGSDSDVGAGLLP